MNRGGARSGGNPRSVETRDRRRRRVVQVQGVYYIVAGVWPLLHFSSYARFVVLDVNPFQAQAFSAVLIVIGAALIEATRHEPPGPSATLLGAATAGAIALVSLIWLPRLGVVSGLWADLIVEVAIAVILIVLYPRQPPERGRAAGRR